MDVVRDVADQVTGQPRTGVWDSMLDLFNSATQGGFAVSPTGGQVLLAAIADLNKEMDNAQMRELRFISERPRLGQLEGAKAIAPVMVDVATDTSGFVTRFRELWDNLSKAEEAIDQAIANYRATELENKKLLDQT
jgi:hypothetical protein